jgi:Na+/H+ antiporter
MQSQLFQYVFLILIILALIMISEKLRIAYPIVLVVGGLGLSFIKEFSEITIDPELIFFLFLPPLLYEAAWQTSWKEFWKWRRVIMSFAFPIVIITSCVVAYVSSTIIPGFTLALGFLLGGIISPPDAISATTIMRNVEVPKSLVSIIEGESLLNDASSLIVVRFALAAIITGQFHLQEAAGSFALVIVMGTAIGLLVGLLFYVIHRWLPTTSNIEVVLTLVTPYCMYCAAEYFHFSGVLAVVSGGLLLSNKRQSMLTYRSRIEGMNVWTNVVFVFNGLVFLLIGLQMVSITEQLGDVSLMRALWYGLAISFVLIFTRLVCTFGSAVFTRFISRFMTVADANPGWQMPLISGLAGMRGVVSLAAALSVPFLLHKGQAFPYRNLILFITFVVILVTLILQGLTLPWVIKKVNLDDKFGMISEDQQGIILQKKIAQSSLRFLTENYADALEVNEHLQILQERLRLDSRFFKTKRGQEGLNEDKAASLANYQRIYLELLEAQRSLLEEMNQREEFDDDVIKKYLSLVDMEELKVQERLLPDVDTIDGA